MQKETPLIDWRSLPGNKYALGVHSAMLSEDKYVASKKIQLNHHSPSRFVNVAYDKEYLLMIIIRKIIKPLSVLGREGVKKLLDEAWGMYAE